MSNRACVKQRQDFCRSSILICFSMYFYVTCDGNWISREQNRGGVFFLFWCIFILLAGKRGEDQNHKSEYKKIFGWLLAGQVLFSTLEFILSKAAVISTALKWHCKPKSTHPAKLCARNLNDSIILSLNFKSRFIKSHRFSLWKQRDYNDLHNFIAVS